MEKCENIHVYQNFQRIEAEIIDVKCNDLSTDQKYLLEIHCAISKGIVDHPVFHRDPGALCHSRWLTTVNRILCLYATMSNPSENLLLLTEFVLKVYTSMWFDIKINPSAINASKHLYRTIEKVRVFSSRVQQIVWPVIQRNGYYAHPKNTLLAMVHGKNKDIRELGLRRVLKAGKIEAEHGKGVRLLKIPKINFDATAYYDLIDWQNILITSPPLLFDVTHDDTKKDNHSTYFVRITCRTYQDSLPHLISGKSD